MSINVTLRGGSGDMSMVVYDPNLDGIIAVAELDTDIMKKTVYDSDVNDKIAVAELEHVTHTLNNEVTYQYFIVPSSTLGNTAYYVLSNRGFAIVKGGDYKFAANIRCANASYIAYLGYRINGGSWVDIGNTNSTTFVEVKMGAAISLNDGDTVEMGLKGAHASYNVYIENIMSWISKVNRLE